MAASLTHPIFLVPSPSVHSISEISVFKSHLLPLFCETLLPLHPGKVLPSQSHPVSANPSVSSFSRSFMMALPCSIKGKVDLILSVRTMVGGPSPLYSPQQRKLISFQFIQKQEHLVNFWTFLFEAKKKKSCFLISWPTGNTHFLVILVAGIEAAPLSYSFTGPLSFFTT